MFILQLGYTYILFTYRISAMAVRLKSSDILFGFYIISYDVTTISLILIISESAIIIQLNSTIIPSAYG